MVRYLKKVIVKLYLLYIYIIIIIIIIIIIHRQSPMYFSSRRSEFIFCILRLLISLSHDPFELFH